MSNNSSPPHSQLRNINKGLVKSLEIGQNKLTLSFERLKSKSKNEIESLTHLSKTNSRPKRKIYQNRYHINEGDQIFNGNVINNVNEITVKPVILHQRELKGSESVTTTLIDRGSRKVVRKIRKCKDVVPVDESNADPILNDELATTRPVNQSVGNNFKETSFESEIDLLKPSERGIFKDIIQKSKRQKLRDENVYEETLQDTYFKRLRDSGNFRAPNNNDKNLQEVHYDQVKPGSDFWNTRGNPLLGYDFIAGSLDNIKLPVLALSEAYFDNLQKFREANSQECFNEENELPDSDAEKDDSDKLTGPSLSSCKGC